MAELETSILTDVVLPLVLAALMFGMGLATPAAAFKEVGKRPRGLMFGLIGQLVALPILAVLVVVLFHPLGMSRDIAIGVLLLGALPGGATSNVLAHLCRGNTALSIVLTAITSLTAPLLTPLILFGSTLLLYGSAETIAVPIQDVIALVLIVITIPVTAGLLVARRFPAFASRSDKPFRIAGVVVLAAVVIAAIADNADGFFDKAATSVPAALVLNLLALTVGFGLGKLVDGASARSISIEVGFQNGTFGILLATTQLESASAALVPAFYSLVMFMTGGLLAVKWARTDPKAQKPRKKEAAAA